MYYLCNLRHKSSVFACKKSPIVFHIQIEQIRNVTSEKSRYFWLLKHLGWSSLEVTSTEGIKTKILLPSGWDQKHSVPKSLKKYFNVFHDNEIDMLLLLFDSFNVWYIYSLLQILILPQNCKITASTVNWINPPNWYLKYYH